MTLLDQLAAHRRDLDHLLAAAELYWADLVRERVACACGKCSVPDEKRS